MAFSKNIYAKQFNLGLPKLTLADVIATGKFSAVVEGNTMTIETLGKAVGVDYVEGVDISYGKLANTTTTVTLSESKVFPYKIEALDEWITSPSLQEATMTQVMRGVAELIDTYILSRMVAVGTGALDLSAVTVTADNILEVLCEPIFEKFGDESVPMDKRKIIVNPSLSAKFVRANIVNKADGISGPGYVGSVMGMDVYESVLLPAGKALAVNPDAFAFGAGLSDVAVFEQATEFIGSAIRAYENYGGSAVSGEANQIIVISLV